MNSRQQIVRTAIGAAALVLIPAGLAQAQQGPGNGPIGPIASVQGRQAPTPAARSGDTPLATTQMHADTHTLSSIEALGIGSLGVLTSFVDPSFRLTQSGETGTTIASNVATSLGMNLAFDRNRNRSRLTGFYRGAEVLYHGIPADNATYHNFGIAEELRLNRWVFRIREDLLSSPEAALGGVDIGGLLLASNNTLNTLQPAAAGVDTILTQPAKRLRTTTSGEINYYLSRRSIFTAAGSYASLTFTNSGLIDNHRVAGRAGYDYLLSPKDVIGLIYDYSRTDFGAAAPHLRTDSVQLAFGRRLTGRWAFQVTGGPEELALGPGNRRLTWTVSNNIKYQTRRSLYSLVYSHSSAAGSGVFPGASTHAVTGSVRHALSLWWSASTIASYSFNRNLAPTTGTASDFGTWSGTASLGRRIGGHLQFALNYGFQRQTAGNGSCPVAGCPLPDLRQTLGIAMEWHPLSVNPR